jgi:hypothetical protein
MPDDLTKQDQFLLKEYDAAQQLTYHIDELRNKLTALYLTFAGVAVAGVAILIKGEARSTVFDRVEGLVATLLFIVALIGWIVVLGLARLRRVQIEYFGIINNIREHFLGQDYTLWNRVQVSKKTLPTPNRRSGTYMWLVLVILSSSSLMLFTVYLLTVKVFGVLSPVRGWLVAVLAFVIYFICQDTSYFRWARRPQLEHHYSADRTPF